MPRKASNGDKVFESEDRPSAVVAAESKYRPRKAIANGSSISASDTTSKSKRPKSAPTPRTMSPQDSVHAFMRSRLLLAALRVWELKHGIHDYF
jgi:hypothetical protein